MKSEMKELSVKHIPALCKVMQMQDFPAVPEEVQDAVEAFEDTSQFGVFDDNGVLMGAFIFGDITPVSAFVDVVCAPDYEGRWLTRNVLQQMEEIVFNQMGLTFLWAHVHGSIARKLALQIGFRPVTPLSREQMVMVLTQKAFRIKNRRNAETLN